MSGGAGMLLVSCVSLLKWIRPFGIETCISIWDICCVSDWNAASCWTPWQSCQLMTTVEFFYKTVGHSRGLESDVQVVCFFCRETTYMHAYICSCLYLSGTLTCIHVDSVLYVYVNSFIHYRKASAWHNVVRKVKFARAWGSFQDGIFPGPGPGFEWGTVTKWWDVTFSSHLVTFQVRWDSARFHKKFV